jgi:MerR family transcriptional regulator/heat shock protein HspR
MGTEAYDPAPDKIVGNPSDPGRRGRGPLKRAQTGGTADLASFRDAGSWADEPSYVISVAARMVGMHAQTLRAYERAGLVSPARSKGNIRLYRRSDIDRLRLIQRLSDLGVNLAGVEVILRLDARVRSLEGELERLAAQLAASRSVRSAPEP